MQIKSFRMTHKVAKLSNIAMQKRERSIKMLFKGSVLCATSSLHFGLLSRGVFHSQTQCDFEIVERRKKLLMLAESTIKQFPYSNLLSNCFMFSPLENFTIASIFFHIEKRVCV